jgi:hypothetical protein
VYVRELSAGAVISAGAYIYPSHNCMSSSNSIENVHIQIALLHIYEDV